MAPLCRIKCHFLTVDNTVLFEIIKNVINKADRQNILFPEWVREKIREKDMDGSIWKAIFNYDGLRRQMTFSKRVNTDGTKVCFHFQVTKKKQNRRKKRNSRKKQNQPKRVISIDPGRVNLITAYDGEKYYKLTRRYYYRATGMKARVERNNKRNLQLKDVYEAMSLTPTKSIRDSDWEGYQCLVIKHYDKLWCLNASEENRRENFRAVRNKERCLDRFLNQFQNKGETKPVIAYGAATMNPTGRGELAVPVKYIYKKCCERYPTRKEDENVRVAVRKESEYTRGLRWCPTCRELVSRDKNACKNIRFSFSFESEERPKYLCEREKTKTCFDLRPRVNSHTPTITKRVEGSRVYPEKSEG